MQPSGAPLPPPPLAHSSNAQGQTHDLGRHLEGVARLAEAFAGAFASSGWAHCAGLWHDLGKNALDFQHRVRPGGQDAEQAHVEGQAAPGRVDHSSAGALHALAQFGAGAGRPLAFVIAGHHAGIADSAALDARLAQRQDRLEAALANPSRVVPACAQPVPPCFLRDARGSGTR